MKQRVAVVTDSSCEIPPAEAARLNMSMAPVKFAFEQHAVADGSLPWPAFYARMTESGEPPQGFGTSEDSFIEAFAAARAISDEVLCLLTPFDVSPSFTTATAAALGSPAGSVRIENPGIASAGLGALLLSISAGVSAGLSRAELTDAIDRLEPMTETLFVPARLTWLERSGRLALIEDRLGSLAGMVPVLRVGTRLTGVTAAETHDAALARAVELAGARAPAGTEFVALVAHAGVPDIAASIQQRLRETWHVTHAVITDLTSTIGSQLGPGAIGIGLAPVAMPEEK